jgi:hypothetical protein
VSDSKVPSGRAAKAASVGAKTVNGPSPLRASTKPALVKAVAKTVKLAATAVSTISRVSSIGDEVNGSTPSNLGVLAFNWKLQSIAGNTIDDIKLVLFITPLKEAKSDKE